jgi:hypothetical protein
MKSALVIGASLVASAHATTTSGTFTALTFNVAGLPSILNSNDVNGSKTENAEEIGTYFAEYGYDIINMQEVSRDGIIYLKKCRGRELKQHRISTTTPTSTRLTTIPTEPLLRVVRA